MKRYFITIIVLSFTSLYAYASYTVPGKIVNFRSPIGMQLNNYITCPYSQYLGLVRLEIYTHQIDSNISMLDTQIQSFQSKGCWVLVLISDATAANDSAINNYSAKAATLAAHYKAKSFANVIFELINEPQGNGYSSTQYANLINTAVPLIRAQNANSKICTGGLSGGGNPNYISEVLNGLSNVDFRTLLPRLPCRSPVAVRVARVCYNQIICTRQLLS